jgi:hypothetical protein
MERTRMTNCLRIHMMDTEELARFLLNEFVNWCCDGCPAYSKICSNNPDYFYNPESFNCQEQMVKWLESECDYYDKR